jgi:hypothetical protein
MKIMSYVKLHNHSDQKLIMRFTKDLLRTIVAQVKISGRSLFNLSMLANFQTNRMILAIFIRLERSIMDFFGKNHHLGFFSSFAKQCLFDLKIVQLAQK